MNPLGGPRKLQTRCRHRGCPALTRNGYCDAHQHERFQRAADERRGTPASRGYDRDWSRLRNWYVREHPWCEDCLEQGRHEFVHEVDHVIPIRMRPDLRLDAANLRSLCRSHHKRKTDRDARQYGAADHA